jgi:hypothetical protein
MRTAEFHRRQQRQRRSNLSPYILCYLSFLLFNLTSSFAAVQQAWVAKYNLGPQSTNEAVAIVIDSNGDIIVAGHHVIAPEQPWPINSPRKYSPYILLKYSASGTQVWARTYSSQGGSNDQIRAMTVDAAGNIFVTGSSQTLMYSSDGALLWEQAYAGRALAVDGEHIYVTGFSNTIFATAKVSKLNGSNIWTRTFNVLGGPLGLPSEVIALDQNTNVIIVGANLCYWNPPVGVPRYVDMYTLSYSSAGTTLWARDSSFGCALAALNAQAIMLDSAGNIYVSGNVTSPGEFCLLLKFDSQGNFVRRYAAGLSRTVPQGLSVDLTGDIYFAGASLDSQSLQFGTVKLDVVTGTNLWHRQYGGPGGDEATAMQLGADSNIYVTGDSSNGADPSDIATLSYDPNGNVRWLKRFNGPVSRYDHASAIAVSPNGDVYVTGLSTTSSNLIEITTIKYIQVSPIEKKSNGNILLTFCGTPGSNYVIEACSTLTNWTNIGSATANSSGVYTFEDTNAPLYQQRFYRTGTE